ncbi:MAG: DUF2344 domain-containing protein [Phycisphaerae bacterium]|nr:DUF2344 domain-containing protein [Phycisphaerae bacterium]
MTNEGGSAAGVRIAYGEFSLGGPLRFLSHQELMDCFSRALVRSGSPVAFSKGFNPRPKVSLPLPRSVGMACETDLVRMELEGEADPEALQDRLAGALPEGMTLRRVWITASKTFPQVEAVEWEIDVTGLATEALEARCREVMAAERWPIERKSPKMDRPAPLDLRRFVLDLRLEDGRLRARLAVGPEGSLRPGELAEALGLDAALGTSRITRTAIEWKNKEFFDMQRVA